MNHHLRQRNGESDKHGAGDTSFSSCSTHNPSHNSQHNNNNFRTVSFSLFSKRHDASLSRKCIFYTKILIVIVTVIGSCCFWYFNDMHYYPNNSNDAYSLSDWLDARMTLITTKNSTTSFDAATSKLNVDVVSDFLDQHNLPQHQHHKCAILFYGLPRSFQLLVLPSIIHNIIRPNARYYCDYFIHYYDLIQEAPSRSGYGGYINATEILLLKHAVEQEHEQQQQSTFASLRQDDNNKKKSVVVHFTSDTNTSFWQYENGLYVKLMHKIRTSTRKRRFIKNQHPVDKNLSTQLLYLPVKDKTYTFQTCENILKMWHSQSSAYHLMQQHEKQQELQATAASSIHNNAQQHVNYTRVALFRSDVVYVTPIDIWKRVEVVNTAASAAASNKIAAGSSEAGQGQHNESPSAVVLDVDNTQAVIPAFAKHPVNDRMFYGPASAAKIWAAQRLERLENHIHERILKLDPGFGMHSERYLHYTIFPAIHNETHVDIVEDESICMLRARADESVWINDCDSSSSFTNKSSSNVSRGTMEDYRAMIESMIGRTCQQSRLPKEIHTHVIQLRCGLNETKTKM